MALPPPDQIEKLFGVLRLHTATGTATFGKFDKVKSDLEKICKMALSAGLQSGLQHGVTVLSGVAVQTVTVGAASMAIFPIGAALGPWLAAAVIVRQANGIFALHDLKSHASGKGTAAYRCSCGACAKGLGYIVDKKENNVAILAVSVFTVGLPMIFDKINSVRKSFQSNRPKEIHSRQFVQSARGGCLSAMATILLLCGKWDNDKPPDPKLMIEAVAILLADDGWARLKSKW
jgi:hypothetical protein